MHKFEIKRHNFTDKQNPVSIYINCATSTVNPTELEKDIDDFADYITEKYKVQKEETTKLTFREWVIKKFLK
jgi:ribosomal protein S18